MSSLLVAIYNVPIFRLRKELVFPPPHLAEPDGLLAVGGDLSVKRLLLAYSMGVFPWYSDDSPVLWWSPDPRLVLFPDELKISRSLRRTIRKGTFTVTMDAAFEQVISSCAGLHATDKGGTWITEDMVKAYMLLHKAGFAHSIESWHEGRLSGGLYGVSLGSIFFGESMFARKSDASKVAFAFLVGRLQEWGCSVIDCQVTTSHMRHFGAREIARDKFLALLNAGLKQPTRKGSWRENKAGSQSPR